MDFTYFVAAFFGLAVGFVTASAFLIAKRGSWWSILAVSIVGAAALNAVMLFDWTKLNSLPLPFLIMDLSFVAAFTLIGCLIGAWPLLSARYIWRRWRDRSTGAG